MSSLTKDIVEYKVSSVLNNDRKQFGKKYLLDGNDETCWNSDQIKTEHDTVREIPAVKAFGFSKQLSKNKE